MYKILINDFENNKQYLSPSVAHYSGAIDMCEDFAFKYILAREGERYFQTVSPWRVKNYIKKGYGICRKSNIVATKLTVFRKDPNGFILSGQLKKMIQFQTVKIELMAPQIRVSEMGEEWHDAFSCVMDELRITRKEWSADLEK